MATIKRIIGSQGISYKITVSSGRTKEGKQVRHYMTFKPPDGMKESRADKEAARVALQFEEKLAQGYQVDNRISFEEYAEYFLGVKQRQGLKKSTSDRYRLLLRRIVPAIGHMKLQDIRPHHLNSFYENLMEPGIRQQPSTAQLKGDLSALMQKKKMSQESLAKAAHLAPSTIRKLRNGGSIQAEKADVIAAVLGEPAEKLFEYKTNSEPLSEKSCLEHHRLVRSILGLAEKELIVPYNAASKATPPKVRKPKINTFQPEEITAILDALEKEPIKWRMIVHLMIVTGARRGEIMGLKWPEIDMEHGTIHICETLLSSDDGVYAETPKTEESQRYINVPKETVELLQEYWAEQERVRVVVGDRWQETGYVFTRDDGQPMHPDSINGWLNKFSERHGLPHINPHRFRHSVSSILINNGVDILSVSKRLGHAQTSTTLNIYSHILQQADARSAECIADVLLRKPTEKDKK